MDTAQEPAHIPIAEVTRQLDDVLRALIVKILGVKTVSYSSLNGTVTGNAYQAVRLRNELLPGFRVSDEDVWVGLGVQGRTVIDLGCNVGERTRLAVRAGADFAEGVEYEDLFVRVAGLINVYNRMHNILIRQGDITQPNCLQKDYDIAACFSAFVYVKENLEEILSRCRHLFVLETHALARGWFDHYIAAVARYATFWAVYGFSDHAAALNDGKRALAVFSRDKEVIRNIPDERARVLGLRQHNVASISVGQSPLISSLGGQRSARAVFARYRERLQRESNFTAAAAVAVINDLVADLEVSEAAGSDEFPSGVYWKNLFRGLIEYVEQDCLGPENTYIQYLRRLAEEGKYDPGMTELLSDSEQAIERLRPRLDAILSTLQTKKISGAPIIIYNALSARAVPPGDPSSPRFLERDFIIDTQGRRYLAPIADGYHRLAALHLSGAESVECVFVWSNLYPINRSGAELAAEDRADGWDDSQVGSMIEDTVAELFGSIGLAASAEPLATATELTTEALAAPATSP